MYLRRQLREHAPIHIDGTAAEKVKSFKLLSVNITDNLNWSTHTESLLKKVQQRFFNFRRLKKFGMAPKTLQTFTVTPLRVSCQAVSLPGMASAPPATSGLSRG